MAYQVLARKWRPQDFSSVVGQEPIVTALRNALTEGRIAQAYLFSGIRGVGKTSVARILAKALNCEKGPAADPCNECIACQEITASADLDVYEIDAATHSKVEQVRDLTEGLKYGPARDRYKVIIIDEIHRLSRQAFDALLKIVEEPPPHLVFIFATTEAEAVPVTILSRCQEFRFRRVPSRVLAELLRKLSDAEGIEVSDNGLRLIARAGDGSVRDSVALLDQLATFGSGTIADEETTRILGGVDHAVFKRLLGAILGGDSVAVSALVGQIEEQGWDPRHVYGEFLGYCRDALHLALGGRGGDVDLPAEEAEALAVLARKSGYENLLRLLNQLLNSENAVRRSETGSLALEICWLRAAELPKLVRIEEILGGKEPQPTSDGGASASGNGDASPGGGTTPRLFQAPPVDVEAGPAESEPAPAEPAAELLPLPEVDAPLLTTSEPSPGSEPPAVTEPVADAAAVPTSEPDAPQPPVDDRVTSNGKVELFLKEVSRRRQSLGAHLRGAHEVKYEQGVVRIHAPAGDLFLNHAALERDKNRRALAEAGLAAFGNEISWKLVASEAPPKKRSGRDTPALDAALDDPRVQKVLDIFGGRVEPVEER